MVLVVRTLVIIPVEDVRLIKIVRREQNLENLVGNENLGINLIVIAVGVQLTVNVVSETMVVVEEVTEVGLR